MEGTNTKWLISNAIVMSLSLFFAINTQSVFWLSLMSFISFAYLIYSASKKNATPFFSSYANQVTAFRFLLSAVTGFLIFKIPDYLSFCLFGLAILLDGLDGYLARKFNQSSEIGALFDKTVDAYFVLLLAFILVIKFDVPFWFIGIGYLHYGYELLILGLGWQSLVIPKNPIGKYIAATLFFSVLSPFILSKSLYLPIIYCASSLVSFSFGLSFFYKLKAAVIQNKSNC